MPLCSLPKLGWVKCGIPGAGYFVSSSVELGTHSQAEEDELRLCDGVEGKEAWEGAVRVLVCGSRAGALS